MKTQTNLIRPVSLLTTISLSVCFVAGAAEVRQERSKVVDGKYVSKMELRLLVDRIPSQDLRRQVELATPSVLRALNVLTDGRLTVSEIQRFFPQLPASELSLIPETPLTGGEQNTLVRRPHTFMLAENWRQLEGGEIAMTATFTSAVGKNSVRREMVFKHNDADWSLSKILKAR
jgi:hypothetical protein